MIAPSKKELIRHTDTYKTFKRLVQALGEHEKAVKYTPTGTINKEKI